jgi:hypothetical protein
MVWEYTLSDISGGNWGGTNLTVAAGLSATATLQPRGYVRFDGVPAVVFSTSDGHISELTYTGTWNNGDLTAITGAPLASDAPAPYVRADRVSSVIFRSVGDMRVREFTLSGGVWTAWDLSSFAGGPASATVTPFPYLRGDGTSSVVYMSNDSHVRELTLPWLGSAWSAWDLTVASGI